MLQLILSWIGFTVWALYIIMTYYSKTYSSINHIETADGFWGYLAAIIIIYAIYKIYTILFSGKKQLHFTFWHLSGFSLFLFALLCIVYAWLPSVSQSPLIGNTRVSGVTLFLHAIQLLIYPIFLVFLARSLGSTLIGIVFKEWKYEPLRMQFLGDIALWFFVFVTGLLILWGTGYYNLTGLVALIILLSSIAIPALGCGLGGLIWSDVKSMIERILGEVPIPILVFEPI